MKNIFPNYKICAYCHMPIFKKGYRVSKKVGMGFSHKVDVVHWYCLKKALGSKGKKGLLKTVKKWCDSPNAGAYAVDLENNTAYRLAK